MKEFIEKLIGRLEEQQAEAENEMHRLRSGDYTLPCSYDITDIKEIASESFKESIQIVNELAEEYINTSTDTSSGWIACSERLPEKDMWCLATFESGNVDKIQYLVTNNWGWNGMRGDNKVIAWMPLPAPYKEGVTENE